MSKARVRGRWRQTVAPTYINKFQSSAKNYSVLKKFQSSKKSKQTLPDRRNMSMTVVPYFAN